MAEAGSQMEIGRLAVERGLITKEELTEAIAEQDRRRAAGSQVSLGEILVEQEFISRKQLAKLQANRGDQGAGEQPIPGYELIKKLGEGGMGAVYKARQISMDRLVALKVLRKSLAGNSDFAARFRREAQLGGKLTHPNILRVFDVGESSGYKYLAMDYVEGKSLWELIKGGGGPQLLVALRAMTAIADALAYLHRNGFIHRDIKPDNILVGHNGQPMLCDLGLSAPVTGDPLQKEGIVMGTPHYMSPEQARGKKAISPRVDIWSFGATLFELLAGQPVYSGENARDVMKKIVSAAPVDMGPLAIKAPEYVVQIVGKCLQKKPEDRYATADDLHRALVAAVDHLERSESETMELAPPRQGQTLLLHVEHQEADMAGSYREYEIGAYLGSGTYGEVYRAKELLTGRHVAFKILRREWLADGDAVERFRREAQLLVKLSHPNIVSVHNWGRYGPTFFIAMDLLEGPDVGQLLAKNGRMSVADAISMTMQVASGMAAVHGAGAVHRDLKPANIALVGNKYVVIDFGMAHIAGADKLTMTGQTVGSPSYMSPEQASYLPVTSASDVYAIGVILYEALTGALPHAGGSSPHELLRRIAEEAPTPITDHRTDLPPAVLEVIVRTLTKNPGERPGAQEVHDILARSVANTPLS